MSAKQGDKELVLRYSKALFTSAQEKGVLESVEKDVQFVRDLFTESSDLQRMVRSPIFSRSAQAAGVGAVLEKAGVSGIACEFFKMLAQNRRLSLLFAMVEEFLSLLSAERGEVTVEVVSAAALQENQAVAIGAALEGELKQKVRLKTAVDPRILGGLVIKIGSKMIDDSVRGKLERLQIISKNAIATL